MRLSKIKLAGFKSFVDPTVIDFVSNLSAVVGPNGCGKSNVMDAIRWVMGESSAKHLRGGQLTDVIFSGSSSRKPLGQASVEMYFDNSDGSLVGEYASYAEVVIRRQVSRDGQSNYYINGLKCRRRDVMDIFMGTGLGPRSYAIIEQGMISRVIESKPEELRVFIEEAAGISKYKERRKETENRIRHTRENLERLTDIRDELEKQLNHLQKQAIVAQKFKSLRDEEQTLGAQLAALAWQRLQNDVLEQEGLIRTLRVELESDLADHQQIETTLEKLRVQQHDLNEKLNEVQGRYYAAGGSISRLEQTLEHHEERAQQLSADKLEATRSLEQAREHLGTDKSRIEDLTQGIVELEPDYNQAHQAAELLAEQQFEKEEKLELLREQWDSVVKTLEQINRQADIEKTKVAHLENQMQQASIRLARLQDEQTRLQLDNSSTNLAALSQEIEALDEITHTFDQTLQDNKQARHDLQIQRDQVKSELNRLQKSLSQLEGRKSSLEALQQAALGKDNQEMSIWLERQALSSQKRLAELITVTEPWRKAVETVLGDNVEAIWLEGVDQIEAATRELASLDRGDLILLNPGLAITQRDHKPFPRLLDQVSARVPELSENILIQFLGNIYTADNVEAAFRLQEKLSFHESVITPEGYWLGQGWIRIKKGGHNAQSGVLQREQELKTVASDVGLQSVDIEHKQAALIELEDTLLDCEAKRESLQIERNQAHRRLSEAKAQMQTRKDRLEHMNERVDQITKEQDEIQKSNQSAQSDIMAARQIIAAAIEQLADKTEEKTVLEGTRRDLQQAIQQIKSEALSTKDQEHDLALELQKLRTELSSTIGNIGRAEQQIVNLTDRIQNMTDAIENNVAPVLDLQAQLSELLDGRLRIETELNQARDAVAGLESEIQALERKRSDFDKSSQSVRERLENIKMDWQALQIHRDNAKEKLANTEFQLEQLLEAMPEDADETLWQARLTKLVNQIQNLGAINLAAIDECESQRERKTYLDAQHADLIEALMTLETAIDKIDKETRARFKETFNAVNENFRILFPKLFGGGDANLGLIGDDLLESGVSVVGRPPGKRNSTIHQLSGGEKALTAVALVFAIFQLNPAPFCLLDEVDAPLDDNNVSRFCNLVKEMSQSVQFIYISHNKLALEMAGELQGVTMREPGVSRIVTVDIEKATQMVTQTS